MLSGNQKGLQSYTAEDINKRIPLGLRETDWQIRPLNKQPMEKETATHSSILAWKISWTQEPGRLQSLGSQGVRHD